MQQADLAIDYQGLEYLGLATPSLIRWNLSTTALVQLALTRGEGLLVGDGALRTTTGPHTGRCPNDRFIVADPGVRDTIDWGKINRPFEARHARRLWIAGRLWTAG